MEWLVGKFLATPVIGALFKGIGDIVLKWRQQNIDATTSHEARVEAVTVKEIELDKREAELNNALLIVEQGNWFTRSVRPFLGWAAVILTWKILVWDLALGQWTQGRTDALSTQAFWLLTTIVIAYMGGRSAEKIADKIAGIWKK